MAAAVGFSAASRVRTVADACSSSAQEVLPRQVAARADVHGQRVVARRPLHQQAEARVREARAGVAGDRVNDVAVAARHQDVGDGLAQRFALGNGGEMLLALAVGGGDQIGFVEPFGVLEDRPRHVDVVVEGEHPHDAVRRGRHVGEPDRKLGARLGLDRRCELGDHLVEQVDLVHGIAVGARHEEVGDARQHLVALGIAAARQRTLEFVDQGRLGCHGLVARCSLGTFSHSGTALRPDAPACRQAPHSDG